jgi:3-isopropylmalate dehydrogenase
MKFTGPQSSLRVCGPPRRAVVRSPRAMTEGDLRDGGWAGSADIPAAGAEHVLVDNCAMALIQQPTSFDTLVTENTFGDILSDEAAILAGSMGMLPSASLGGRVGLYEPVHGTAPDIAGQGVANPIAAILSAAMLLRYSLGRVTDADRVEAAVLKVLEQGYRTRGIHAAGTKLVGTAGMGDLIAREVEGSH